VKLPVVSGSEAVKAFAKAGYEFHSSTAATSFSVAAIRRTDGCRFQITRSLPGDLFER
jgi:hypothetical protein